MDYFGIVCLVNIPHYSQFCQFSYLLFDINQFRFSTSQFLFLILVTRKFGRFTYEPSLILRFETSAILKFNCLKCLPSSYAQLSCLINLFESYELYPSGTQFYRSHSSPNWYSAWHIQST